MYALGRTNGREAPPETEKLNALLNSAISIS